jgi:glycosyltransferase involved in cell wall biosynthesis
MINEKAAPNSSANKTAGHEAKIETDNDIIDLSGFKVIVVIPAYNEERFIGSIVLKIRQFPVRVMVVDDGSTDATAAIARTAGAKVHSLNPNQGKGAALNFGFIKASKLKPDAIIVIDGDGQHLPEEIPQIVSPILKGEADIIVGSRYLANTSNTPAHRRIGHKFLNLATSVSSGVGVSDSQCGYRAFSRKAYEAIHFNSSGFSVESEMQFLAKEKGLKILEIPVTIRYLDKGKRPAIKQGMGVLNGILHMIGQYRPLLFFGGSGFVIMSAGIIWGIIVVERFAKTGHLAVGYTMICVLLSMVGLVLFSTGITLHSIRALLLNLFRSEVK